MDNKNCKVRCVGYHQNHEKYFTVGKVYDVVDGVITSDKGYPYGNGVWCGWLGKEYYKFERVEENTKIVTTTDGKTTTARLFDGKELVKKAEAKCSPDDKFDFMVGANLAMERLEEKKPVNPFKVGEYVRVTGDKSYGHALPIGSVGRVKEAYEESCYVDGFYANGYRAEQWVGIHELEKI
jgi:hypothetical protein